MAVLWSFLVLNIFHKNGIPTIILRCLTCLNLSWIKSYDIKHNFLVFPKLHEIDKDWWIYKTIFSSNFDIFLIRLLCRHLVHLILKVLAWEIWNMKYEFAKKIKPKSQLWCQCCTSFFESDVISYKFHIELSLSHRANYI